MSRTVPLWPLDELAHGNRLEGRGVLDAPPEDLFNRLTRLVARHFGIPYARIVLSDDARSWCAARYALEPATLERALVFGRGAFPDGAAGQVMTRQVMVVPDLRRDERFAGSPLVDGPPHLRFYAAAPLKASGGRVIGALCIADPAPRSGLDAEDAADLEDYARLAVCELEGHAASLRGTETAESRLRENVALMESILESAADAVFAKDREGRYTLVNSAAARMVGHTRGQMVGTRDTDWFPPMVVSQLREVSRRVMESGREETVEQELPVPGGAGDNRIYMMSKVPLRDADGNVVGVAGMARDITDRKRSEVRLRVSEARFRALIDHTPQLMWVNRPDGRLEFLNSAWRTYTGHTPTEATRWDEVHPDDRALINEVRTRGITAGEPYCYEMRLRRADGAWRWHLTRSVPMRENGRIVAWVGTAVDVHDIRRAQQVAEEADRTKTRFLAAASHDLRQPMQSMLLFAGALRAHVANEPAHRALDRLQQGLDTMKDLLDSLLDVSRLDAGIVAPQIEDFPITDLFGQLAASYASVAEAKGLIWQVVPCAAVVRSDRVLLGRMLRNLVDNAIRYTKRGRVLIECVPQGTLLRVEVRDTGIGIPADQQTRIFEEFHQIGNPERDRDQGLGLGLAVVRRLSRLLDHPVEIASNPGRGSIFSVGVPLVDLRAAPVPPTPTVAKNDVDGGRRFAVVVEDDAIVMMGLATMLREWDFDVLTAGSTDQAMNRLHDSRRRPDIVLVDYRLRQGRVGTEAVLRVRDQFGPDVPGVIITGEIGPEPQRDAAEHGLGMIHKPVTPRLLKAALARHLEAVQAR